MLSKEAKVSERGRAAMRGVRCALLRSVTHWYELLKRFVLRIVTHCYPLLPIDGVDLERPSIGPPLTHASPACSRCDLMRRPAAADAPVPPLLRLWVGHG